MCSKLIWYNYRYFANLQIYFDKGLVENMSVIVMRDVPWPIQRQAIRRRLARDQQWGVVVQNAALGLAHAIRPLSKPPPNM